LLATRQAKVRVCEVQLAVLSSPVAASLATSVRAGSAAEFSGTEDYRVIRARALRQATVALERARRDCAGLEALEHRRAAAARHRRRRSEAREADERNRMLQSLRA
jgi:hypothetical protein